MNTLSAATMTVLLALLVLSPGPTLAQEDDAPVPPRYYHAGSRRGASKGYSSSKRTEDEPPVDATPVKASIDEARGSFQTLVETWIGSNQSADGSLEMTEPDTERTVALRLLRADPTTVHETTPGLFSGEVIFVGPGGKKYRAQAVEDLRTASWLVTRVDLMGRKRATAVKDPGSLFGSVVLAYIESAKKREGAFYIHDDTAKRRRRLKLRMISPNGLVTLDPTHFRAPVHFTEEESGAPLNVDFFVSASGDTGQVYKMELNGLDASQR